MSANGKRDYGESVKLDREIVAKYRKLQLRTKIPLSAMIEHAMTCAIPMYEAVAVTLDPGDDET